MATLLETSQINKREDLSDLVSIADASATIFTTMIPKGKELGNRKFEWQVDAYEAANSTGVIDGRDVDTAYNSTDTVNPRQNSVRISNYGHYWRRSFRISPLSEVSNTAGYKSELSTGMAKKTVEVKRDLELTMLGTQPSLAPTSTTASATRGLGMWTQQMQSLTPGTTATYDQNWTTAPGAFATPTSSVETTATSANISDSTIQALLASIFTKTGTVTSFDLIAGTTLRRAFSNLVARAVTSANFPLAIRQLDADAGTFTSTIDIFQGDFGTVRVSPSNFTPTAITGYIVPMDKVELRYGFTPRTLQLTNNGGGEGRLIEAYGGLVVKNPLCLGKLILPS